MPLWPAMRHDEIGDLLAAAGFCRHRQPQVGPVEAVDEHGGLTRKQSGQNVGARGGIGGRGEGHGLHAAELRLHRAKRRIFRPEIMAPLRDAMRLVDRQERDLGALEQIERIRTHQPLRRDIDEAQFAARQAIEHRAVFVRIVGGIERRRGNAIAAQLRDLIAHQRDQRRHHDGKAVARAAPEAGSTATCRCRSASPPAHRGRRGLRRRSRPGRAGRPRSRRSCGAHLSRPRRLDYLHSFQRSIFVL